MRPVQSPPFLFLLFFFFLSTLFLLGLLFLSRTCIRRTTMGSEFPNKVLTSTRFSPSSITLWLWVLHPRPSRHHSFALQLQGFLQNPSFCHSSCRDSTLLVFSSQASPGSCVSQPSIWSSLFYNLIYLFYEKNASFHFLFPLVR